MCGNVDILFDDLFCGKNEVIKMDLGAYAQIDVLEEIAKVNNIDIPRIRGYRLMKDEEPVSQEDIKQMIRDSEVSVAKSLCVAIPFWSIKPECWEYSSYTDYIKDFFLTKNKEGNYIDIRWDRIHGWKRKVLKFEIKKQKREIQKQYDVWNKYAGQGDVLYIHSRMGGNNWKSFEGKVELTHQPWFLDRVDDAFDSTYCDFYARIKV